MKTALDFDRLTTPREHGDVLVEPCATRLRALVEANRAHLARLRVSVGGIPLRTARSALRSAMGLDDRLLIVTGHQPDFIHAGVWAKHVVAMRLAEAVGGAAVNLVVDHDAPRQFAFAAPRIDGEYVSRILLRYADWLSGAALEGIPAATSASIRTLRREVADTLGDHFKRSQLPVFFDAYAAKEIGGDWVEQAVTARRAVEQTLGVNIEDRRVSRWWYGPLLCVLIGDAERFLRQYNRALWDYREEKRIGGSKRPIPDLDWEDGLYETALWAYRIGEPRQRLFVRRSGDRVTLVAGDKQLVECSAEDATHWVRLESVIAQLDGWCLRPRALTLTMWARLLLGDLFIHGIGGAQYDRITDRLIRGYFGVNAPAMVCVSATLRLPLPHADVNEADMRQAELDLRDFRCNPDRNGALANEEELERLAALAHQKRALVSKSQHLRHEEPHNRRLRRAVFEQIRGHNDLMVKSVPRLAQHIETRPDELRRSLAGRDAATNREYFFALHPRENLELLLAKLPSVAELRGASIVDTSKATP